MELPDDGLPLTESGAESDEEPAGIFAESKGLIAIAAALVIVVIGIMVMLFFGGW